VKVTYINYLYDTKFSSVGAAVHVREFSESTKKRGVDISPFFLNEIAAPKGDGNDHLSIRDQLKKKMSRYVGQLNALFKNISYFHREWRLISAERPDVVLVRYNLLNFSVALVAKIKKIPFVLEVNAPMAFEDRQFNKKQLSLPFFPEWVERLNLKLADRVYTVSNALRNYYVEQGVDPDKVTVVPNGVDMERFHPDVDGMKIKRKYKFEKDIVLGFTGSFHYWHGLECFEQFIRELQAKYENVSLLLVGDGPLKSDLEETFSKESYRDKVVFTGYIEHRLMPEYIAAMDIVLAPYPEMDFFYFSPLKLFEYMAAGKAIVASAVGQIAEIVQDGHDGMLYKTGNIEQLVEKISKLVEDEALRKNIGNNARKKAQRDYSWQSAAAQVIDLMHAAAKLEKCTNPSVKEN